MSTSSQRALKALLSCLFVAFFSQWVLPTAPVTGQTTLVAVKELTLTIDAPDEVLEWGETAAVMLVVANPGQELVEGVALHLPRGRGLLWEGQAEAGNGPWLELGDLAAGESRTVEGQLRVVGVSRIGRLRLHVGLHGRDMQPVREKIVVRTPQPARETTDVPAAGGEARLAGGRVRLSFPPGWNERDARLLFQLEELYRQAPDEAGQLLLFEIAASGVDAFDAPVEAELQLGDLTDGAPLPSAPVVMTRASETEPWTAVESVFDPASGVLRFTTEHFSSYQVVTDPQVWKLTYNPPGASAYSGAATHGYSIQLPPGIGGLTPDLSLSYSSRPAEGMRVPAMAQRFGAGWGLPEAQINNGNSGGMYKPYDGWPCCNDFHTYNFTLVLNGVTYYLTPATTTDARGHGVYVATSGPELGIEFVRDDDSKPENDTANVTGEFWRVRTADGTTYTFGRTADAEQVVWPVNTLDSRNGRQPRNKAFSAYNWKLSSIEDVHGNRVEYVYETACGQQFADNPNTPGPDYRQGNLDGGAGKQCTEVDAGLKEIRYNFDGVTPQTVVTFTNASKNGNTLRKEELMNVGVFRPTKIEVRHGGKLISRETFAYSNEGAHYFAAWDVATEFWTLASITHAGSDGKTLPVQSFIYDQEANACDDGACIRLLTRVNNGYGAVTTIGYAGLPGTIWRYVTTLDTWDGVATKYGSTRPQTRTQYTPSTGKDSNNAVQVCYDKAYHVTNNPCHSRVGPGEGSSSLIGFDFTTMATQAPAAPTGTGWTTLNKAVVTFYNDDYWLLGQTDKQQQLAPSNNGILIEDDYNWTVVVSPDGKYLKAQLVSETHTKHPTGTWIKNSIDYTYYALDPALGSYGTLKTKVEKDENGTAFRCTEYAYVSKTGSTWLINRPERETVRSGNCSGSKQSETLYRYFPSTFPGDTSLDDRGLLTYVLRWVQQKDGMDYYSTEKREYHANGLPSVVTTFSGLSTFSWLNSTGAYTSLWRNTTTMAYNALGLPLTITVGMKDSTTKQTETMVYDTIIPWLVASVSDANGIVTGYSYDVFGRLLEVASPGDTTDSPTIWYAYYDNGDVKFLQPLVVGVFYKDNAQAAERQFYDGLGRLVQSHTAKAEVEGILNAKDTYEWDIVTSVAYDARGLEVCRTAPHALEPYEYNKTNPVTPYVVEACDGPARTTTTYDALGRPLSVTTPDGAMTEMAYGVGTDITVDGHSRLERATTYDANEHVVNRYSDAFGRLVMVREFTGNSTATYKEYADTRYSYDVLGNLTAVGTSPWSNTQPAEEDFPRRTTMSYDGLGRKTGMTDADMGTWEYKYWAGNLSEQRDGNGKRLCFKYDNLNRLIVKANGGTAAQCADWPVAGDILATYTYGTSNANNNVGKLTKVSWGSAPTQNFDTFAYDAEGRVASQTRTINGREYKLGNANNPITYDVLDRPLSVLYPNNLALVTTYDEEGVETLTYGGTGILSHLGYTAPGQPAAVTRANNLIDTTYGYYGAEENFRLKSIQSGPQSLMPAFFYTTYDNVGNLTGYNFWGNSYTYTYDALNRLDTVSGGYSHNYNYDELGNFDTVVKGGVTWDYKYRVGQPSRLDEVTGLGFKADAATGYDAQGYLKKYTQGNTTYTLTYDVEGRLTSVKTESAGLTQTTFFFYDAGGNRTRTLYPNGTNVYTPYPDYEEEVPSGANPTITQRVTFSANGQVAVGWKKVGGTAATLYSLHTNHLGSVVHMGDSSGARIDGGYAMYEPFGAFSNTPPGTNPSVTDRGFTGHRQNNTGAYDLKLIYMNARYYHPQLGRFVSPDTIVPDPANPQSYNRYSYARNSPLKFTDPTGHKECGAKSDCSDPLPRQSNRQYDLTEWLATELLTNANGTEVAAMEQILAFRPPISPSEALINFDTRYLQMLFGPFWKLNTGEGLWDIKLRIRGRISDGIVLCSTSSCRWVDYSVPGNIKYGYIAALMGVPQVFSKAAGGFLEVKEGTANLDNLPTLLENPYDWAAVEFGYYLYDQFGRDITIAEFRNALTIDVLNSFQAPPAEFIIPGPAKSQTNTYPPGYFNYYLPK